MKILTILLLLGCSLLQYSSYAQDPFFTHFHNNKSHFNPALVGYRGAFSVDLKRKTQWNQPQHGAFESCTVAVEEAAPCNLFDWGVFAHYDREGIGRLETHEFGLKFAATFATSGKHSPGIQNLRIGGKLQLANKRIDFSRLIFSDQLDPQYGLTDRAGNPNPTSFVAPSEGIVNNIFTPAVGVSYHILFDKKRKSSPILHLGVSTHHVRLSSNTPLSNESLLASNATTPFRINAFVESELILKSNNQHFYSLSPLLMWQRQANLEYFEVGTNLAWNRTLSVGMYYHFNQTPTEGMNANWLSFVAEVGVLTPKKKQRIDIGIAWSNTASGFRNRLGPILEFSFAWHFKSSPSCNLMGKGDAVPYSNKPICWIDNKHKKLYNNIWYR